MITLLVYNKFTTDKFSTKNNFTNSYMIISTPFSCFPYTVPCLFRCSLIIARSCCPYQQEATLISLLSSVQYVTLLIMFLTHIESIKINNFPAQNIAHVPCMLHATYIYLLNMHVVVLTYLHVSCNMHGFQTLSLHAACM